MFEQSRGVKRGREQDSDPLLDRHGNVASSKLFITKLPHNVQEQTITDLFSEFDGFISVQLGNKALMAGEFRTCVVAFSTIEQATAARVARQHFQATGWSNAMLINFVKQDSREPQYIATVQHSSDNSDAFGDTDTLGNRACATIFVKNLSPEMTQDRVAKLFPTSIKVVLGNKQLNPGEFRTGYITFEDAATAVSVRRAMYGFKDDVQQVPLAIYFSVRPQDQHKSRELLKSVGQIQAIYTPSQYHHAPYHHPHHSPLPYSPSPYTTAGTLSSYASIPSLYTHASSYSNIYSPIRPNPYHSQPIPQPNVEDALYSISDLFDSKGNAATNTLFVNCLPYNIRENQVHAIFSRSKGFKGLHMGIKALTATEYRTAVIHFDSTENALQARAKLQHYHDPAWSRPLIINYVKH